MLLLKTAFKNILGAGKRTWLNVTVLSFTFVLMVAYNGTIDGWKLDARRETRLWETGAGQFWHPDYDRFDVFTLQDAHGLVPPTLQNCIQNGSLTPILVTQGVIYPQGRMQNVLIKGIDPEQDIVQIPTWELRQNTDEITAITGSRTAQSARLQRGDRVMLRWRDKNGAFDAKEILIAHVFETKVPTVDIGQIWMDLTQLRQMTNMPLETTYLIASDRCPIYSDTDGWIHKDLKFLMADLDSMIRGNRVETIIIFSILLAIALLAVFDTQTLSIFRRQREIGTYVALGMTPRRVTHLFTLEGTCFSLLSILVSLVWGTPAMALYAQIGYKMPKMVDDMGVVMGRVLYPVFQPSSIFTSIVIVVGLSALISYLPTRKIAKQNVVEALKGKIV
ncbi:MAG: FtsX-like permease family protein [Bacteroidetes bacterium]|nr:FtsX-like permease family protein [Bacteroidota bacterium]